MTHKLRRKIFTGFLTVNKQCNPHLYCCCSVAQSCLPLWDTVDCSEPDSSVHGISQARIVEWVAISFSMGSSWLRNQTCISCIGRHILYHWATWKAQISCYKFINWTEFWNKYYIFLVFLEKLIYFPWKGFLPIFLPVRSRRTYVEFLKTFASKLLTLLD